MEVNKSIWVQLVCFMDDMNRHHGEADKTVLCFYEVVFAMIRTKNKHHSMTTNFPATHLI